MGQRDYAPPTPVEPLDYLAVTDEAWQVIWKILGTVGMIVAACRVATGILTLWALGWFGFNPFGPNTVVGNGSLFETACGLAIPTFGGISFVGSLSLLQRKPWAGSFLRACESGYLGYFVIATGIQLYLWTSGGPFGPGNSKLYLAYVIASQALSTLSLTSFSLIAIPLLTAGIRRQARQN